MEIIKCGLFLIPKLTKKHWYFAMFFISTFLRTFIPYIFGLTYEDESSNSNCTESSNYSFSEYSFSTFNKSSNSTSTESSNPTLKILLTREYFELLRNISSDLIIGIFCFFDYIKNKKEYKKGKDFQIVHSNLKNNFIYNDESKSRQCKMIKLIFIISFIDIICQLSMSVKYFIEDKIGNRGFKTLSYDHLNSFLLIDVLSRYFFSRYILKTYFYLHHYFSFGINFISIISFVIIDIIFKYPGNYDILYTIIIGLKIILYSLEDIMNKVAFTTLFIPPKTLIFYKGLFQAIVYLPIITIVFFLFKLHDFQNIKDFLSFQLKLFICFIPCNIFRTISLVDVIDRFTAQHMSFLKIFEAIILFIFYLCNRYEEKTFEIKPWGYMLQIFAFIILLFSSLVHNEIIIINIPKLKAKTEYYLDKDADREQNSSFNSDTLFTDSREINNNSSNLYSDLTGSDLS